MGRRTIRRSRRSQTPGPTRRSPLPADSESLSEGSSETEDDPDFYRYSGATAPVRGGYTPAPTHPVIPSVTTGMAVGSPRLVPPSPSNLRSESRQRSSQGSSGLTYVSDGPVIPPLPPGFVPYPDQTPEHRQNPFPTPRAPPQQSPLHPAPVPPPPQMYRHKGRASDESQSD